MKIVNTKTMLIADALIFALAVFLDQITKYIVRLKLALYESVDVIPGVFQFFHHENTGASWGLFKGGSVVFIIVAGVVTLAILFYITQIPPEKKFLPVNISLTLIAAGAIGNVIDRVHKGSVTDFLYAKIIDFPVFNVADIFIVCATAWFAIMMIFVYKEDELKFMDLHKTDADKKDGADK